MAKHRIQLDLTDVQRARLEHIRERTDAASVSEVFRRSISIYERMLDEEAKGNTFGFLNPNQEFVELIVL